MAFSRDSKDALESAAKALSTSTSSIAESSNSAGLGLGLSGLRNAFVTPNIDLASGLSSLKIGSDLAGLRLNFDDGLLSGHQALRKQIAEQTQKVEEARRALQKSETTGKEQDAAIKSLQANVQKLEAANRLSFLLSRVCPDAQQKLLSSEKFQKLFLEPIPTNAFVMSVDIRRSTELMLKAKSPEHFSHFITSLCEELVKIVQDSFGVLDKFTGDGVLAFFPDFYSGKDSGYCAIAAADKCHEIFRAHYKQSRTSFTSVLMDVGLGIGIDYGEVHLIQMAGGLTVVGKPVVYACRLSAAPAGLTYLNQPAYEEISEKFSKFCLASECTLDVKHEGMTLAYAAHLTKSGYTISPPTWPVD